MTDTPETQPSLINEAPKDAPAEPTPESKLFPESKPTDQKPEEPAKPEPTSPKTEEPKPEEPKKEEPKAEPSKPSEPAKPAATDYENLKLPEGNLLSPEEVDAVKKEALEQKLTIDEAQGVLEVKNDAVKAFAARQNEILIKARQDWKAAWSKDPEFGGDKLAESSELAKRAWDKVADNELKTLANQTGFGDHPAVLRAFARLGRMFSEDQLIRGNVGGTPEKGKSPEEILYGKTTPGPDEPMS